MKQIYTTITVIGFLIVVFKCSALKEIRHEMKANSTTMHFGNHTPVVCFINTKTK